ncbi:replication protein RepA, partial [Micrococcus luteus]|nr:replication protein RepA [Micrococcus luteus]
MDRPKPGEHVWTRRNGRVTYTVTAGAVPDADGVLYAELPSGRYARAALLYLFSESWVTERATVDLGMCTHQYLAALGVSKGGVTYREAVRQLNLVAAAQFTIQVDAETTEDDERGPGRSREITGARLSERVHLWEPAVRVDPEAEMSPATITLSRQLIEMARRHSVPVPWEAWGHLMRTTRSPLALDVYVWLCARLYKVPCTTRITWEQLHVQFGSRSDLCATSSARSGRLWQPSRRSGPRSAAARAPATRSATPAACASPRGGIRRISPSTRRRCPPTAQDVRQQGKAFLWTTKARFDAQAARYYHPELAVQVWGRARARMLSGPMANGL